MSTFKTFYSSAALFALAMTPVAASGGAITATDLTAAFITAAGPVNAGPVTADVVSFNASGAVDIGDLTNTVYFDGLLYTYTHKLTPTINGVSEFNTAFNVTGFTGTAGYSFSEATTAGITSINIFQDPDGTIDWNIPSNAGSLDSGEMLTFFFVSDRPPSLGSYNVINNVTGTAVSFAPVPVPASALAMVPMLGGLALLRKYKGRQAS